MVSRSGVGVASLYSRGIQLEYKGPVRENFPKGPEHQND